MSCAQPFKNSTLPVPWPTAPRYFWNNSGKRTLFLLLHQHTSQWTHSLTPPSHQPFCSSSLNESPLSNGSAFPLTLGACPAWPSPSGTALVHNRYQTRWQTSALLNKLQSAVPLYRVWPPHLHQSKKGGSQKECCPFSFTHLFEHTAKDTGKFFLELLIEVL